MNNYKEKYKLESTMQITQCENGICLKETVENDDFDELLRVYTENEKKKSVGNLLLEDVDYVIEKSGCNKVKVSITIESVEG